MAYQFSDAKDASIKFQGIQNAEWNVGKVNGQATADETTDALEALLQTTGAISSYNMTDLLRTVKQNVTQVV